MQPFLRVKIKSLAAEAKIIRHEERKYRPYCKQDTEAGIIGTYASLRHHRLGIRSDARSALLAYGMLRGRTYLQIEAKCDEEPNWTQVSKNVMTFGPTTDREATYKLVKEWRDGTYQCPLTKQAA